GIDAALHNALHAIRTFFHNPAGAHGHIRVTHHLELRRLPILEEQEVKATYFVRTVVVAVPRAHAAVINHVIEAFAAMYGRADRTNQLTRRVFALHAGHRLEERARIGAIALVICVHPQPVHVPALVDLLLPDHRNVVLRHTSQNAGIASDACVVIDDHAPLVRLILVVIPRVKRERAGWFFFDREPRILLVFLEGCFSHERARSSRRLHRLLTLSRSQQISFAGFPQLRSRAEPGSSSGTQPVNIEPDSGSDATCSPPAVSQKHGYRIVGMTCLNPDRTSGLPAL